MMLKSPSVWLEEELEFDEDEELEPDDDDLLEADDSDDPLD
jgi:hypothetical protein